MISFTNHAFLEKQGRRLLSPFKGSPMMGREKKADIIQLIEPSFPLEKVSFSGPSKISKELKKPVAAFLDTLLSTIGSENLPFLNDNLNQLEINRCNFIPKLSYQQTLSGVHYPLLNKIEVVFKNCHSPILLKVLYHELLHMASTVVRKKDKKVFSGFSQGTIGFAFNEGYTEHLRNSLFGYPSDAYQFLQEITSWIEEIVEGEEMRTLYFKADLYHLIQTLELYDSKDNIIKVLQNLDFLFIYFDADHACPNKKIVTAEVQEEMRNRAIFVCEHIFLWFCKKIELFHLDKEKKEQYAQQLNISIPLHDQFLVVFQEDWRKKEDYPKVRTIS